MNSTLELETIERGPADADAAVIWMHGLGADGSDFEPIVPELRLPAQARVRFVFPHAPVRPITVNGGIPMRAWYDIVDIGPRVDEDVEGTRRSEAQITRLIEREAERGVPPERLVLAGFSQGGAIALHTGVRYPQRLAGLIALSSYVPLRKLLEQERHPANNDVPIFMAHGRYDQVVPYTFGELSRDLLKTLGYQVEWHEYPMEHNVSMEEVADIGRWLSVVLQLG